MIPTLRDLQDGLATGERIVFAAVFPAELRKDGIGQAEVRFMTATKNGERTNRHLQISISKQEHERLRQSYDVLMPLDDAYWRRAH